MGKFTLIGPVPEDDPMFTGRVEVFSTSVQNPSSTDTANTTTGKIQEISPSVLSDLTKAQVAQMDRDEQEEIRGAIRRGIMRSKLNKSVRKMFFDRAAELGFKTIQEQPEDMDWIDD